ncbi:MAG: ABC transporter ATP-binding protein [Deltaproteobacteria bacterium]|nr:ABC transporter ATP-binding protein [Deltaproteobacteria bacterium]
MPHVLLQAVAKRFGDVEVLRPLDLSIEEHEFIILLGPSGCGKSTTLRIIAGLESPTSGRVFIRDRDVTDVAPRDRDLAMVFQSYALYPHLTVRENLAFGPKVRRLPKKEIDDRIAEAAAILGLEALLDRKPKALSGGQRQRVAMGRAIVRRPSVFLFDEPLSNLDAALRSQMRAEIAALHRRLGATTIYVTHDQVEAMTLGSRLVILNDGVVQQMGDPLEVYAHPENLFVGRFLGAPAMNHVEGVVSPGPRFVAPGLDLKLSPGAARWTGQDVVAAFRPQALSLNDRGPIVGEVELVEMMGSESFVRIRVPNVPDSITARVEGHLTFAPKEMVHFDVHAHAIHLFDRARGVTNHPRLHLGSSCPP